MLHFKTLVLDEAGMGKAGWFKPRVVNDSLSFSTDLMVSSQQIKLRELFRLRYFRSRSYSMIQVLCYADGACDGEDLRRRSALFLDSK